MVREIGALVLHSDRPEETAGPGRAPGYREGGSALIGFVVDDVDAAVGAAATAGGRILQAPEMYPWGRRALVVDPDGRTVELLQRPGS